MIVTGLADIESEKVNGSLEVDGVSTLNNDLVVNRVLEKATYIPKNADLNTVTYLKVGQYASNRSSISSTLSNSPTVRTFKMFVHSTNNYKYDNESSETNVYRTRIIIDFYSNVWIQRVSSSSTAGSFYYGEWQRILYNTNYKDLTAFTYSTTEQWTGKYDHNGRKIYSMYLGEKHPGTSTATIEISKTFANQLADCWIDDSMSYLAIKRSDGLWEYRKINNPTSGNNSQYVIESWLYMSADGKTVTFKISFGTGRNTDKFIHPYILYTYK